MYERLNIPLTLGGLCWHHSPESALPTSSHTHQELEVNLTVAGTAVYLLNGRRVQMHPGTLLWLFPAQEHLLIERSSQFEMWIAVWKPSLIRKLNLKRENRTLLLDDPKHEHGRLISPESTHTIDQFCRNLQDDREFPDLYNSGLSYLLMLCWHSYLAGTDAHFEHPVHPAVQRAAHRLTQDLHLDDSTVIAEASGLSRTRLSRLFKQQMGISLTEFRSQQRLQHFMALKNQRGHRTLLDLALESGFGSYAQFHRTFTRFMGKSPSVYF